MPLINVMRTMAEERGMSEREFDVHLSVYIEAGSMTNAERHGLLSMDYPDRLQWLASKSYPVDAMPMVSLDFDAWGFITPDGLATFAPAPAHAG